MRVLKRCALAGLVSAVLLLAGCMIYPYGDKNTIATRTGTGTNVVERLVCHEYGVASWVLLSPGGGGETSKGTLKHSYFVEGKSKTRVKVLNGDPLRYLTMRAVAGTNLWVWYEDEHMAPNSIRVCLINPKEIVRQRVLTNCVPRRGADSEFDLAGRYLMYPTPGGFKRYDVLSDTIEPMSAPPDTKAVAPR
jgi:hypothetical protein